MILCKWSEEWLVASKASSETPSCALMGGAWPRLSRLTFKQEVLSVGKPGDPDYREHCRWHKFMATMVGITFYPTLRYMGIPVYVGRSWHPDSEEPLLGLLLGDINPTIEAETGLTVAMMPEVNRRRADDEEAWKRFHDRWKEGGAKVMQRILNDGWERTLHGFFKYVHVADPNLEKIEGPPPEGPF